MTRLLLTLLIAGVAIWLTACETAPEAPRTRSPAETLASKVPDGAATALVVRVVDGDTIDVQLEGQTQRVRYIGIDTPKESGNTYALTGGTAKLIEVADKLGVDDEWIESKRDQESVGVKILVVS